VCACACVTERAKESICICVCVCTYVHICRALICMHTHIYNVYVYVTGWRRLIGSPKLQIISHKRATQYESLLQKMTYKDNGSYESSPPCTYFFKSSWNVCVCACMGVCACDT